MTASAPLAAVVCPHGWQVISGEGCPGGPGCNDPDDPVRPSRPVRIQRRRTKGWRMPKGALFVGRPTEWGNPWRVGDRMLVQWPSGAETQRVREVVITAELAIALYRIAFTPDAEMARADLAGHDLACWCPLDQPCHADVLLELANRPRGSTTEESA